MEWGAGRYERIAEQLLGAAEVVVEQATPREGERVVDIGCGTGNAALLAAERGATVTGVDPAQRLLDVAACTAAERGLNATFTIGEAADIPVEDNGVDVALSVFGVIFAPDPEAAAAAGGAFHPPDAAGGPGSAAGLAAVRLARARIAFRLVRALRVHTVTH